MKKKNLLKRPINLNKVKNTYKNKGINQSLHSHGHLQTKAVSQGLKLGNHHPQAIAVRP